MRISLTVNGRQHAAEVAPRLHLADFVREQLNLTGTHIGCEHGICGACTVELDGELARSCITYAVCCDGAEVRTIEAFDDDPLMQRLRRAFAQQHALQCGYCTPGMLIAARDLVRRRPNLSRPEIRVAMSGNLCRCTGYIGIINAIAQVMAEGAAVPRAAEPARTWLGPAPGPTASTIPPSAGKDPRTGARKEAGAAKPARPAAPAGRASSVPIPVSVTSVALADGTNQLSESFELAHPRPVVWGLLSKPERVARCLPGMSLEGPPHGEVLKATMALRIGPVTARFTGEGSLRLFPDDYRQVITARGGDRNSDTNVSGSLECSLFAVPGKDGQSATRVAATMSYVLTGRLAQIGRSALARDLARRVGEAFAANLDAELRGSALPAHGPLRGGSLLFQLLADRVRALWAAVARWRWRGSPPA